MNKDDVHKAVDELHHMVVVDWGSERVTTLTIMGACTSCEQEELSYYFTRRTIDYIECSIANYLDRKVYMGVRKGKTKKEMRVAICAWLEERKKNGLIDEFRNLRVEMQDEAKSEVSGEVDLFFFQRHTPVRIRILRGDRLLRD